MKKKCEATGCGRPHKAKGLCRAHYLRLWKGRPRNTPVGYRENSGARGAIGRFRNKLEECSKDKGIEDCWEWGWSRWRDGYGMFYITDRPRLIYRGAHIFSWELAHNQSVPEGMIVRHTCDNPPCINPHHLLLGTHADNTQDMISRGRHLGKRSYDTWTRTSKEDVTNIRRLHSEGLSQFEIARQYGLSFITVHRMVHRKTFKNV